MYINWIQVIHRTCLYNFVLVVWGWNLIKKKTAADTVKFQSFLIQSLENLPQEAD